MEGDRGFTYVQTLWKNGELEVVISNEMQASEGGDDELHLDNIKKYQVGEE